MDGSNVSVMRSEAPSLMPIFRSRHQAVMLAHLFLHPDRDFTATQLARCAGVPLSTAHRELSRLVDSGILLARPVGRARLLRANLDHRGSPALADLLRASFGPTVVVAEEFSTLRGVDAVVVFGSWAARFAGVDGPPPADVDVLVVGNVSRNEVYDAAERAEHRLEFPVNPVLRTEREWAAPPAEVDPLVEQVRSSEHLVVLGGDGLTTSTSSGRRHRRAVAAAS